ncbi:hypothetical protein [Streptomyces barkulensis]|uniref:hypothetical protein n=1 Tax=Streptomyces barkulensis TaxID=1257026 RepID=UPI0011802BD9|nr:hypothetical protein [Streptomyces barkulensis]
MGAIDWGDAPTWLGAVFAALAAAAAVWTLKSQRDQIDEQREFIRQQSENLALERAELQAVAEDRKREQASRVTMVDCHLRLKDGDLTDAGAPDGRRWYVAVQNGSSAPIFSVQMTFGAAGIAEETAVNQNPAAGHSSLGLIGRNSPVKVVGAGDRLRFDSVLISPEEIPACRPVLYFTDEAGVRWSLDEHGKLEEVTEGQAGE